MPKHLFTFVKNTLKLATPQVTYFDYNATTPVDSRVLETMWPFFSEHFGNAASQTHALGWYAHGAVDKARQQVANLIGTEPEEIVFTSGSTEAINLAIKGAAEAYQSKGKHIITCQTEHKAVLDTCYYLQEKGFQITFLSVDMEGRIDLDDLKNAFTPETIMVAIMAANNETGVLQDLDKISEIVHENKAVFFSDTTQLIGKLRFDVNESGIDVCCLSAHKLYGPKGVGALYVRRKKPRVNLIPLIHGGGHENGRRSGTLNVPGIVGLGQACEIAQSELWDNGIHISKLKNHFEHQLLDVEGLRINGSTKHRLYNTSNICFPPTKDGESLIKKLPAYAFSAGSACSSASATPSHVLKAMHLSDADIKNSFRFSFGKENTIEQINSIIKQLKFIFDIQ